MAIAVQCSGCGGRFSAPDALAGRTAKCALCHAAIDLPFIELRPLASESIVDLLDAKKLARGAAAATPTNPPQRRLRCTPMPALFDSVVKARISRLQEMDHSLAVRLRTLVEVRYYQAKRLASAAEVRSAYEALLSPELASKMESSGTEQRIQATEQWAAGQRE